MSEALSADISIGTHEAFRNLAALLAVVDNAQKSLENMGGAVRRVESETSELSLDLKEAEEQLKKTGAEADRTRMEELRKAMADATEKAARMRQEQNDLKEAIDRTNGAQNRASREFVASANEMEKAGAKAGEGLTKGQKDAKDATDKTKKSGEGLLDIVETITTRATGMVSSFLGMGLVVKILQSMEESLKNSIDSLDRLSGRKMALESSVQDVVSRLGFTPDKPGQDRANALVTALQQAGGGVSTDVASTILNKAQGTGFTVAVPGRPDMDTKTPGFDIAAMVSRFAGRQHLDADTAGKLFNLAQASGAKSKGDVEGLLAQMEGAFREIAISDPSEGYRVAIRAVMGRIEEDRTMTVQQAMGAVAAAGVGASDPRRMVSSVEAFSRAAMGSQHGAKFLAGEAAKRGVITPDQIAKATEVVRPRVAKDSETEVTRVQEEIEREQSAIDKSTREQADAYTDYQNQRQREVMAVETAQMHGKGTPQQREEAVRERQAALDKLDREMREKLADAEAARNQMRAKVDDNRKKIADLKQKDAAALREMALAEAYAQLPVSAREEFLYNATEGMTEAQTSEFVSRFSQGAERTTLLRMLSPAARAVRSRVVSSAGDVAGFRARQDAYTSSNTLSLSGRAAAAAQAAALRSTPGGAEFQTEIFGTDKEPGGLVKTDIDILQSNKFGGSGIGASATPPGTPGIDASDEITRQRTERVSLTESGLQARRAAVLIYDRFRRWIETLDPRTRARNDARIREAWKHMIRWYKYATSEEFGALGVGRTGTRQLDAAKQMAIGVGATMQEVNADAAGHGEKPGEQSATGLRSPAEYQGRDESRYVQQPGQDAGSVPTERPLGEDAVPSSGVAPSGPAIIPGASGTLGPPAPASTPGAAAPATTATPGRPGGSPVSLNAAPVYNLNIGTVVSQGADALTDLPGRLELPDLA